MAKKGERTAVYTNTGLAIAQGKRAKKINKDAFFACLELFIQGRATTKVCAEALGLSEPTLKTRFNIVLLGEVPPDDWWLKEGEAEDKRFGVGRKNRGYTINKDCKRWQEATKLRKLKENLKNTPVSKVSIHKL